MPAFQIAARAGDLEPEIVEMGQRHQRGWGIEDREGNHWVNE
jgi:hypothetical protein